jgi:hypothetical protein
MGNSKPLGIYFPWEAHLLQMGPLFSLINISLEFHKVNGNSSFPWDFDLPVFLKIEF